MHMLLPHIYACILSNHISAILSVYFVFLLAPHIHLRVSSASAYSLLLPCMLESTVVRVGVKTLRLAIDFIKICTVIIRKQKDTE